MFNHTLDGECSACSHLGSETDPQMAALFEWIDGAALPSRYRGFFDWNIATPQMGLDIRILGSKCSHKRPLDVGMSAETRPYEVTPGTQGLGAWSRLSVGIFRDPVGLQDDQAPKRRPGILQLVIAPLSSGKKPKKREIHKQFRFLESIAERWIVAPNDTVKPSHGAMPNDLSQERHTKESNLGVVQIWLNDVEAMAEHCHGWTNVFPKQGMETRSWRSKFLGPQTSFSLSKRTGNICIWGGSLEKSMDLLPQHANGTLPIANAGNRWHLCRPRLEHVFKHLEIESFLVAEIVREQREWAPSLLGNHSHACTIEPLICETDQGGLEQGSSCVEGRIFHTKPSLATRSVLGERSESLPIQDFSEVS